MTDVKLFKDIGLNMSMKRTIDFPSKLEQRGWFDAKPNVLITNIAYNKLQNVLNIPYGASEKVKSYDEAQTFTYALIIDLDEGKNYYCFIDNVTLIDASTLHFTLALDPMQTYMGEFELDECMVSRAHVDRWNKASDKPIRITPNKETIDGFYTTEYINSYVDADSHGMPMVHVIISYTTTKGSVASIIFPIDLNGFTINVAKKVGEEFYYSTSNFGSLVNGSLFEALSIDVEKVINVILSPVSPIPWYTTPVTIDNLEYSFYYKIKGTTNPVKWVIKNPESNMFAYAEMQQFVDIFFGNSVELPLDVIKPTKPSDNDIANDEYEPALYFSPYRFYKIMMGNEKLNLVIPENFVFNGDKVIIRSIPTFTSPSLSIKVRENFSGLIKKDEIEKEITLYEGGLSTVVPLEQSTVISNNWLSYRLQSRDEDRQIVKNNSWQQAIDNLVFMSYGGALVGSRSASGRQDPMKHPTAGNTGIQQFKGLGGVASAVGMAAGASVVSSLVDAHYAWQNQMLNESKIRNKPNGINILADGVYAMKDGISYPSVVVTKCDDTNYQRAYNNFRYYGYTLNNYMTPNLKSRKYFNYILTQGAVIKGSLNNNIKQELATIFDNGITIFHGDYSNEVDYPDKENIERVLM